MNNLPDKEFKALVIKTLTKLGKGIDVNSEHFTKELENIKKDQIKNENSITGEKTH